MLIGTNDCERGGSVGNLSGRYDEESKCICDANLFVPSQTLEVQVVQGRPQRALNCLPALFWGQALEVVEPG